MKKSFLFVLLLTISFFPAFTKTINDGQIIPSGSQIYSDFLALQANSKKLSFTNNTPISVAELKFYLKQYDYDKLDEYGQYLYNKLYEQLYEKETILPFDDFILSLHPRINLEGYYKTNKEIPWSFKYYYKDNFISLPLDLGFGENLAMGADFFLGKNAIANSNPQNFCNIPLSESQFEFYFPTFAYAGFGKNYDKWGYNFHVGKQGKTIGQTLSGSTIYNKTFETDAYFEFDIYTSIFKFTMDVVQISSNIMDNIQQNNSERYLYIHQFDVNLFKKFKLSAIEGSLVANPFSLRFLNPLPFMHQFGGWKDYTSPENREIYYETNFCADFAVMFEYIPIKNLRLYGIYNQIEMQLSWERGHPVGKFFPNSIGAQMGINYLLNINNSSNFDFNLEGFYNSPYMYIKPVPSSSLYRKRSDMQTGSPVYSWIGLPYGPDCIGTDLKIDYNKVDIYTIGLEYTFLMKGEKDFTLFDSKTEDGNYDYYPTVTHLLREKGKNNNGRTDEELYKEALNMWISGVPEISNKISINFKYNINKNFEINTNLIYSYIINSKHIENIKQNNFEFDCSIQYKIF